MLPVAQALQTLRGVSLIVSTTTIAELGDLTRFASPVELMSYLGLVPSEHSSGEQTKRGSITKTGNGHVRRVLVEFARSPVQTLSTARLLRNLPKLDLQPLKQPGTANVS